MKRLLTLAAISNNLDNPDFIRAIIMHWNTPIERGLPSPNELLFGRNVPDYLPARETRTERSCTMMRRAHSRLTCTRWRISGRSGRKSAERGGASTADSSNH